VTRIRSGVVAAGQRAVGDRVRAPEKPGEARRLSRSSAPVAYSVLKVGAAAGDVDQ